MNEIEFYDYIKCPVFYDAVHRKKLPFVFQPTMNEVLNKVAYRFFLGLMNGTVMSMSQLKKTWDNICNENSFITEKKCLEGISLISKMYLWAQNEQLRILDIKTPYVLRLGDGVELTGEIDTISINSKNNPELLHMDFSQKLPDQFMLDMKMKYTFDSMAFKNSYGKDIGVHVHNVKNNQDFFTYRSSPDFIRGLDAVKSVHKSIKNNIYYPRENAFCATCKMKVFCRQWNINS